MENSPIKLSISMIVKNEEVMLPLCLESVIGADEIVIVDTGSKDKTKEVAAKFTDKIFDFPWNDDFAAARNFAKNHCTGDWILSIDADEFLEPGGIEKIREAIQNTKKNCISVKMVTGNHIHYVPRLFKNIRDIYFNGKIHEVINDVNSDRSEIVINFGASPAHELDPERNLRILEKAVSKEPFNTRYLFYLGREYGYKKDWKKAIDTFQKYTFFPSYIPERADAFFMMAVCFLNLFDMEKVKDNCLKSIGINANFKAPLMLMSVATGFDDPKSAEQWKKMALSATNENTLFVRENFNII